MALTSTMYTFEIDLSDNDRSVYEQLKLSVAMHPSETFEFMVSRVLAYCLEFEPGLTFSKGLADLDEPALFHRAPDGRYKSWIEIGFPDSSRLHKAAKLAERVAVYTHRDPRVFITNLAKARVFRGDTIPIYSFEKGFATELGALLDRRNRLTITVNDRHLYLDVQDRSLSSAIVHSLVTDAT